MEQNYACSNCGTHLEGTKTLECPVCKEKYEIVENGKLRMTNK